MIGNHPLKKRDLYLNKLIAFQDTEPVKVVTGIRRCGKSSVLKLMAEHLRESGVHEDQILEMNFESYELSEMTSSEFYQYVKKHTLPDRRMYYFFDEVQHVDGWENAVNSFRVDFDCDIYVTGSNAYMLSSEYATYLSGRMVEIKMLPLSFAEFINFYGFEVKEAKNAFGEARKTVFDSTGNSYELTDIFNAYLRFGGMPGILDVGLNQERALVLLEGIYSTVIMRDILERDRRKGERKVTDPELLNKVALFLADNIGSSISVSSMGNVLVNEGLLDSEKRKGIPSAHTVQDYVSALKKAYLFYNIKRFDIRGKDLLRTQEKYYIVDIGLRNYLLGFRDRDIGHVLENIVYFELLRRGYDVAVGKIGNNEIDFIAKNAEDKIYSQVTESMTSEDVRNRELAPLKKIRDNYEKIVLTLHPGLETTYDGIHSVQLIDWLLSE